MRSRKYSVGVLLPNGDRQAIATYTQKGNAARMYKTLSHIAICHPSDVTGVWMDTAK